MLLQNFELYSPESVEDYEMSREAHKAIRHYIQACDTVKDLESVDFPNFLRAWGEKYKKIGAADTASREAAWSEAERYLSLRDLLQAVTKLPLVDGHGEVKWAMEAVKGYFGIA